MYFGIFFAFSKNLVFVIKIHGQGYFYIYKFSRQLFENCESVISSKLVSVCDDAYHHHSQVFRN